MARQIEISDGEWYHCYNRGVDRRKVFSNAKDYERFLALMYVANGTCGMLSDIRNASLQAVLANERIRQVTPLVDIGSYCLMPNHVHFVIKQNKRNGISKFMQRLFTGYTMYFNQRNERTGPLFAGPFKARHLSTDRYFKHAINYVHMNPVELFEPNWKSGMGNVGTAADKLREYRYSSLPEHTGENRLERKILGNEVFTLFDSPTSLSSMLFDAQSYYRESAGL